jgi:hypothetical protein
MDIKAGIDRQIRVIFDLYIHIFGIYPTASAKTHVGWGAEALKPYFCQ